MKKLYPITLAAVLAWAAAAPLRAGTAPAPAAPGSVAPAQAPAPSPAEAPAVKAEPSPAPAPAAAAPAKAEPAPAPAARRSACPYCFQPLLDGYAGLIEELKPWVAELESQAAAFEDSLSAIQKDIDAKDAEIARAKEGTDKKAVKAEVKKLSAERKVLLKKFVSVTDEKSGFYRKYSKEVKKRIEAQIGAVQRTLMQVQSAASSQS